MIRLGVVAIGVANMEHAVEFWQSTLNYRLRTDGFGGWDVLLEPTTPEGLMLALQHSQSPASPKPRIHLDLHVDSRAEQEREVARLISLGAARVNWDSYPEDPDFVVLADPDGNRFCVVNLGHAR